MAANTSFMGHDQSGLEASLLTSPNLLNADPGETYFATDTLAFWLCTAPGVWARVGSAGLAAPGAAGSSVSVLKTLTALADNVATNLAVVTIPNAIHAGILEVLLSAGMGDGDSAEASVYTVGFSRIAGAAAKITLSAKSIIGLVAGATGNAVATLSNTAVGGAVGAANTFQLQAKIARSAGAATNHVLVARLTLLNNFASGMTIA